MGKAVYGLVHNQLIEKIEVFDGSEIWQVRAKLYAESEGASHAQWEKIKLSEIAGVMTYPKRKICWRHREYWTEITEEAYLKLKSMIGV